MKSKALTWGIIVAIAMTVSTLQAKVIDADSNFVPRRILSLSFCAHVFGTSPIWGYEGQLTRKTSFSVSGGIGGRRYDVHRFPKSGTAVTNLDFRWYPIHFERRALAGPFCALHTGFRGEWIHLAPPAYSQFDYYQRLVDFGANLGFQWVFRESMMVNGQFGMGYYLGTRLYDTHSNSALAAKPTPESGFNVQVSFGAGIAF